MGRPADLRGERLLALGLPLWLPEQHEKLAEVLA